VKVILHRHQHQQLRLDGINVEVKVGLAQQYVQLVLLAMHEVFIFLNVVQFMIVQQVGHAVYSSVQQLLLAQLFYLPMPNVTMLQMQFVLPEQHVFKAMLSTPNVALIVQQVGHVVY